MVHVDFRVVADLADPGHPGHLGLAGVGDLLLAPLREEEVNLVIVSDRAVDALLQQHRSDEICLCAATKHTHTHRYADRPISSKESVSLETKD